MKNNHCPCIFLAAAILFPLVACSSKIPEKGSGAQWLAEKNASNQFTSADLGPVPGGLMEPTAGFFPLLPDKGNAFLAKTLKDTTITIHVANKQSCTLKAEKVVALVAKNGKFLRVLTNAECGSDSTFVEGFVPQSDLQEVSENSTAPSTGENSTPSDSDSVIVTLPSSGGAANSTFTGCTGAKWSRNGVDGMPEDFEAQNKITWTVNPKMMLGEWFRNPAKQKDFTLNVTGDAAKWKVNVINDANSEKQKVDQTTVVDAEKYKISEKEYHIAVADILAANKSVADKITWQVFGLDATGAEVGSSCTFKTQLISPLVLDLANRGLFEGIHPAASQVRFDFLGNGNRLQSGWVAPHMGFLAFDKNKNGVIDDGTELFGHGTKLESGNTAANGYLALAEFDTNNDGFVSPAEKNFKDLVVWVDANINGATEKEELKSLAELNITRIGVRYSPSHRHGPNTLLANDARYEARFWGPQNCGTEGCLSFDVYFATVNTLASK